LVNQEEFSENILNKKVQVGPYYFSSEKLLELNEEDLQKQAEILTEISNDDFSNLNELKIINSEVSKQFEKMEGDLSLNGLTSAKGLVLPESVEYLSLNSLTSAEGLILPESVSHLELNSLTSAEGLILPESVGELYLDNLITAEGLILPESVKYLYLNSLTSAEGLVLPKFVYGLGINNLPETEKQKLRKQRPDLADKI
jgi:hypothetical protein